METLFSSSVAREGNAAVVPDTKLPGPVPVLKSLQAALTPLSATPASGRHGLPMSARMSLSACDFTIMNTVTTHTGRPLVRAGARAWISLALARHPADAGTRGPGG